MRRTTEAPPQAPNPKVTAIRTLQERLNNQFPHQWRNRQETYSAAGRLVRYPFEGHRLVIRRLLTGSAEVTVMQSTPTYTEYVPEEADSYVTTLLLRGEVDPEFIKPGSVRCSRLEQGDSIVFAPHEPGTRAPQLQQFRALQPETTFESVTLSETPQSHSISDPHRPG